MALLAKLLAKLLANTHQSVETVAWLDLIKVSGRARFLLTITCFPSHLLAEHPTSTMVNSMMNGAAVATVREEEEAVRPSWIRKLDVDPRQAGFSI